MGQRFGQEQGLVIRGVVLYMRGVIYMRDRVEGGHLWFNKQGLFIRGVIYETGSRGVT